MNKGFLKGLNKFLTGEPGHTDKFIVTLFLEFHQIAQVNNSLIADLIISEGGDEWSLYQMFKSYYTSCKQCLDFEELIELFEFVVSPSDKVINGAVYTPSFIRDYIINDVLPKCRVDASIALLCDVACGCGGFLYTYASILNSVYNLDFATIYNRLLYGIDITQYSVDRTCILLSLLAITRGSDEDFSFNIICGNSLEFTWSNNFLAVKNNGGFDFVVSNPPYVCAKNISDENKHFLQRWSVSLSGNTDLYIPFFQLGIEALNEKGVLSYITVNTFTKSLNGRKLRNYLSSNSFGLKIIDFGGEQLFKGRNTYTCICTVTRKKDDFVKYLLTNSSYLSDAKSVEPDSIPYSCLNDYQGWMLGSNIVQSNLFKLRTCGRPLIEVAEIRGGFATLKNSIYLFNPKASTKSHYLLASENGKEYWIEKSICRNAVKANSVKQEDDLTKYREKIIFPYKLIESSDLFSDQAKVITVISESELRKSWPNAYQYLSDHKKILAGRDKGKGEYKEWYAFGRSQGLNVLGYKLLFPHISDRPYFVLNEDVDLLFYTGFSIISWDVRLLRILQKILVSKIFWYYIKHASKPYSGNYFALGKNYMKGFSVPNLSFEEEEFLINCEDENAINKFLISKYGIIFESGDIDHFIS